MAAGSRPGGTRVAVVTGANRGLGREVARQLATRGYATVVTARDARKVARVSRELGLLGHALDVAEDASVSAFATWLGARFGGVDALVNNAGIHYDSGQRAATADLRIVREALDVNLLGAWRTVESLLPLLSRGARVVNVSSGAGSFDEAGAGTPAYSVSKAALNMLTVKLAHDLRSRGVLVNAVCPGWVATDMGGRGGRPVGEGAAGVVWAADLPPDGPTGRFFRDARPIRW